MKMLGSRTGWASRSAWCPMFKVHEAGRLKAWDDLTEPQVKSRSRNRCRLKGGHQRPCLGKSIHVDASRIQCMLMRQICPVFALFSCRASDRWNGFSGNLDCHAAKLLVEPVPEVAVREQPPASRLGNSSIQPFNNDGSILNHG